MVLICEGICHNVKPFPDLEIVCAALDTTRAASAAFCEPNTAMPDNAIHWKKCLRFI